MSSVLHRITKFITQFLLLADINTISILIPLFGLLLIIIPALLDSELFFYIGGFIGTSTMALLGWVQFYRREAPGFGMRSEFYAMFSGLIMMIAFGVSAVVMLLVLLFPQLN